jgi:hypothetical protein
MSNVAAEAQRPRRLLGYVVQPPLVGPRNRMIIHPNPLGACTMQPYAEPVPLARVYARSDATAVLDGQTVAFVVPIGADVWKTYLGVRVVDASDVDLSDVDAERAAALTTGRAVMTLRQGDGDNAPRRVHTTAYVGGVALSTTVER